MKPFELLTAGIEAYQRKDYTEAERLLSQAIVLYGSDEGGKRTANIYLGRLYKATSHEKRAIECFERGLPYPASFKGLISIYRELGKQSKKDGNYRQALAYFNRMLGLSKIWHHIYGQKKTGIDGQEVDKATVFLRSLEETNGTIYVHDIERSGPVPDDVLLSARDYKVLRELQMRVNQGS